MLGDKLIITEYHRSAAKMLYESLEPLLQNADKPLSVTVAGESGSGKSETAAVLGNICCESGYEALVLQQDDYFVYPPKTNHRKRVEDISWVGPQEVKIGVIQANVDAIIGGNVAKITKPLVDYDADSIGEETVSVAGVRVVIVEGTYTTLLENIDLRAFIDRDYRQTKKARYTRSRDPLTGFLEKVLAIEHGIISKHKSLADLVIPPPEDKQKV